MRLSSNVWLEFNGKTITDDTLEYYRKRCKGKAIMPGIQDKIPEEMALHALLYETTPFTINNKRVGEPLVLTVTFKKFPYSIDGKEGFSAFSIRLVPKQGNVKSVELDENHTVAVNTLSAEPDRLLTGLGNGSLWLEIFFTPQTETLEELGPPTHFRKEIFLNHDSWHNIQKRRPVLRLSACS